MVLDVFFLVPIYGGSPIAGWFFSENCGKSQSKMDDKCPNGDFTGSFVGFSEVFQMRFLGLKKQKWGFNQQKWWYNGIYGGDFFGKLQCGY